MKVMRSNRKKNEGRVVAEFEEERVFSGNKFMKQINSPKLSNMTKKTVFLIALATAVVVNIITDLIF